MAHYKSDNRVRGNRYDVLVPGNQTLLSRPRAYGRRHRPARRHGGALLADAVAASGGAARVPRQVRLPPRALRHRADLRRPPEALLAYLAVRRRRRRRLRSGGARRGGRAGGAAVLLLEHAPVRAVLGARQRAHHAGERNLALARDVDSSTAAPPIRNRQLGSSMACSLPT
ncbi:hypothetical protein BDA96_10G351000 [Sorghum bicolor]|uniref:Uncharacterized protein n=1 Tax=Sorghum bicolor TaxID=4558 RepID=A0A921U379_SORBI|nr:hypothetical protein BDA96_10G351000 [Sorghum bicolor]